MRRREKPPKAKVEAKLPGARESRKSEDSRVGDLEKRLAEALKREAEALDQQTATAEILRVISSSPTDVQPVFDTIAESALRLCGAASSFVTTFDGELLQLCAQADISPEGTDAFRRVYPLRPSRGFAAGRAILTRAIVHVADVHADAEYEHRHLARAADFRSILAIPMLRDGRPIGTINAHKAEPGPFTDNQIDLLKIFADQAVIAIENVRLFAELQERNHQVTESLEQQTATSEILRVISSSPMDIQPVLEIIARNAARVCGASDAIIRRVEGDVMTPAAHFGSIPMSRAFVARPITRDSVAGRAILERKTIHLYDLLDPEFAREYPEGAAVQQREGYRTIVVTPLLREGNAIGMIAIRRVDPRPFTDKEIALLQTFADQAVIAIENVRLFTELEARNRDLTQALDRQTATSEILRVISSSPTDVQPVFDAIVASARRLCDAVHSGVYRVQGDMLHFVAHNHESPEALRELERSWPIPVQSPTSLICRVIRDRAVVHVIDIESDPTVPEPARARSRVIDQRTLLAVPMLCEGIPIGAIRVSRREPKPFSDQQIELLKIFADQAVIAIENARVFKELQTRTAQLTRSVEQLTALGEVGRAVSSTLDLQTVLSTIVGRAAQLAGTDAGVIYEYEEKREVFVPRATAHLEAEIVEMMLAAPVRKGEGATGRLAEVREAIQLPDILEAPTESRVRDVLVRAGYRALLAVPLVREDHLIGGLTVIRKATGEFAPEVIDLLRTFATQSALAIQNARLFLEIEDKSRQLEVASRHKSEFLANMSHELRTPLNAIIGFSEVLTERMFGDLNEKQEEYLKDIYASGQHLLSLINDILDLSKIEAGRMELELTDFDLPTALDNALTLVRERAGRRGITLQKSVDERLGQMRADERKIRQVVLNLLSNAIKFTPEGGRIEVRALPIDGVVEVSVSDTGVGIAPQDQETVFEEFRQVGTAAKKVEGTGLGLALSRKFIELHGGRIWVKSRVGEGSTFTFTLPVHRDE